MQSILNRASLTVEEISVRPAQLSDRAAMNRLTENNHRVHFNLDWWSFDQWLPADGPSEAIWLAFDQEELIGLVAVPFEQSPVVWLRSMAISNGYPASPVFTALFTHARSVLLAHGVERVAVMAHPEWVDDLTQKLSFTQYNEIITLRKSDRVVPDLARSPAANIRLATPRDIPMHRRKRSRLIRCSLVAFGGLAGAHPAGCLAFRRRRDRRSGGGARLQRCLRRARPFDTPGDSSRLSAARHWRTDCCASRCCIRSGWGPIP